MNLVVGVVALVVVLVVIAWLIVQVRSAAGALSIMRGDLDQVGREIDHLRHDLDQTRSDLEQTQRDLSELKAATEIVPAPPLPKARSGDLDDLREQLRAAHREPEPSETPEA